MRYLLVIIFSPSGLTAPPLSRPDTSRAMTSFPFAQAAVGLNLATTLGMMGGQSPPRRSTIS